MMFWLLNRFPFRIMFHDFFEEVSLCFDKRINRLYPNYRKPQFILFATIMKPVRCQDSAIVKALFYYKVEKNNLIVTQYSITNLIAL